MSNTPSPYQPNICWYDRKHGDICGMPANLYEISRPETRNQEKSVPVRMWLCFPNHTKALERAGYQVTLVQGTK